jgi:hypothetical protein
MNIYQKLNMVRQSFHTLKLKKTGYNKFSEYAYFELCDFLIPALNLFDQIGLCAVVSFTIESAEMRVVDIESGESFTITSPFGSAKLKACHEVQNIGAVETYQRRYLWVALLEIVEHDALDAVTGSKKGEPETKPQGQPLSGVWESTPPEVQEQLQEHAVILQEYFDAGDTVGLLESLQSKAYDTDIKAALWTLLPSNVRSAIKKGLGK